MDRVNLIMIIAFLGLLCSCQEQINSKGRNDKPSEEKTTRVISSDYDTPKKSSEKDSGVDPEIIELAESKKDVQLNYQVVEWARVDERLSAIEDELARLKVSEQLEAIVRMLEAQSAQNAELNREIVEVLAELSQKVSEMMVVTERVPSSEEETQQEESSEEDEVAYAAECSEGITFTNTWLSLLFTNRLQGKPAARRLRFHSRREAEMFMFLMENVYSKNSPQAGGLQLIKLRFERGDFDDIEACYVITNSGDEVVIDVVKKVKDFVADKF